jgi:hypothetical protein
MRPEGASGVVSTVRGRSVTPPSPKPSEATKNDDQPEPALSFYDPKRGLMPVTQLSYPVASLREAWMRDLQVHAFASGPKPAISAREVLQHLTGTADEH